MNCSLHGKAFQRADELVEDAGPPRRGWARGGRE
jgi:hypothetical protein